MYGVLYAISPEIFPAKHRGTGNGLTAMATRLFGILVRFPLRMFPLLSLSNGGCTDVGTHYSVVR